MIPSAKYKNNYAFFQIVMLAYNIWRSMKMLARRSVPKSKKPSMMKSIVSNTVRIARLKNALRARIENGIGAVLCATGLYAEAIPHLKEAIHVWQTLGNDVLIRVSLNNLALCHSRLGQYQAQLETATIAHQLPSGDRAAVEVLFTHHHAAVACCFLGLRDEGLRHLDLALSAFGKRGLGGFASAH